MELLSKTNSRLTLMVLLTVLLLSIFLVPLRSAKAAVPVVCPVCDTWGFNTSLQITGLNFNWNIKNNILNPAATFAVKTLMQLLRDWAIQWIATGQFGVPQFQASFFADPSKWAENAARLFLSELTGINFCNYNLNVPKTLSVNVRLAFDFRCNFNNYQNTLFSFIKNPSATSMADQWLLENSDPLHDIFLLAERKHEQEVRARNARNNEVQAGRGFLGRRNPITGKIDTPGEMIAGYLGSTINSDYRQCDAAKEWQEALLSCGLSAISAIVDAGTGKILQGFLGKAFAP